MKKGQVLNKIASKLINEGFEYTEKDDIIIRDDIDNTLIVNTLEGIVWRGKKNKEGKIIKYRAFVNGSQNYKCDGYTVAVYNYIEDGKVKPYRIRQHILIELLANLDDYIKLYDSENLPVVNHIDNCPWNNKAENLEWTTVQWNNRHGRLVHSLDHYFPNLLTEIKENNSKRKFLTLKRPISVEMLKIFDLNNPGCLNIKKTEQYYNLDTVREFIEFIK